MTPSILSLSLFELNVCVEGRLPPVLTDDLRIMLFILLQVYLLDDRGRVQFTSLHKEEELREGDDSPDFIHAFNGYAPAGDVTGDMVYVNFARVEDLR